MTPTAFTQPPRSLDRVRRASSQWALALGVAGCVAPAPRQPPAVVACAAPVTAPVPEIDAGATRAAPDAPRADVPTDTSAGAATANAVAPCEPLPTDPHGVRRSPPQIFAAARRYFVAHTRPGSRHPLGPDVRRELPTLQFGNAERRETGAVMQSTLDEVATRYPDSLVFPTRPPRLRPDACFDEVFLDLTEDGRYLVIVETETARPVFMYWQQYRP